MSDQKPLIVVACAVIHNKKNDTFLLGQRAAHKHNGGYWEFLGGKKGENETILETMEREIEEEIGIKGKAIQVITRIDHDYVNGPHVDLQFIEFELPKNAEIKPNPDDHQNIDWIKREDLKGLDLSGGDKLFAETLVNK